MARKLSFLASGIVAAAFILGFAIASPLPAVSMSEAERTPIPTQTSNTAASRRVYCYNGVKRDEVSRYRGWICEPEHGAASAN